MQGGESVSDIRRYADSGVHTVEGNVAGRRAAALTKKREAERLEYVERKKAIERKHTQADLTRIDNRFLRNNETAKETDFRAATVGLVTADEFRQARAKADAGSGGGGGKENEEEEGEGEGVAQSPSKAQKRKRRRRMAQQAAKLSFAGDDDDDDDDDEQEQEQERAPCQKKKRAKKAKGSLKNPNAETEFLPDVDRDRVQAEERRRLQREWLAEQERLKREMIEITYSYWDGSGHRRTVTVPKGTSIGRYLEHVKQQLTAEFSELRAVSSDNLLYVKEDLIIPHNHTFYDLIVTKARGKSGPLFHFDVHDDIRLINDARIEKDESHPGKVCERSWYERNKHIFPASRWEVYDPAANYGGYTIAGGVPDDR